MEVGSEHVCGGRGGGRFGRSSLGGERRCRLPSLRFLAVGRQYILPPRSLKLETPDSFAEEGAGARSSGAAGVVHGARLLQDLELLLGCAVGTFAMGGKPLPSSGLRGDLGWPVTRTATQVMMMMMVAIARCDPEDVSISSKVATAGATPSFDPYLRSSSAGELGQLGVRPDQSIACVK